MAGTTTRLGLRKPDPHPTTGDLINVTTDINDNADKIDAAINFHICTSGTRPVGANRWDGREIFETDTRRAYVWSASVADWLPLLIARTAAGPYLLNASTDTNGEGFNIRATAGTTQLWRSTVAVEGNPRFIQDAAGLMSWGAGSSAPDTTLYRSAADTLKTDDNMIVTGTLSVQGAAVVPFSSVFGSTTALTGTTTCTSATYINMPTGGSLAGFVKRRTDTAILIWMRINWFSTGTNTFGRFGVLVNGTDYDMDGVVTTDASKWLPSSSFVRIPPGVPAATYTLQGRWRRSGGTGTLTASDWWSMLAVEGL
jgi:hypothetical protein